MSSPPRDAPPADATIAQPTSRFLLALILVLAIAGLAVGLAVSSGSGFAPVPAEETAEQPATPSPPQSKPPTDRHVSREGRFTIRIPKGFQGRSNVKGADAYLYLKGKRGVFLTIVALPILPWETLVQRCADLNQTWVSGGRAQVPDTGVDLTFSGDAWAAGVRLQGQVPVHELILSTPDRLIRCYWSRAGTPEETRRIEQALSGLQVLDQPTLEQVFRDRYGLGAEQASTSPSTDLAGELARYAEFLTGWGGPRVARAVAAQRAGRLTHLQALILRDTFAVWTSVLPPPFPKIERRPP